MKAITAAVATMASAKGLFSRNGGQEQPVWIDFGGEGTKTRVPPGFDVDCVDEGQHHECDEDRDWTLVVE